MTEPKRSFQCQMPGCGRRRTYTRITEDNTIVVDACTCGDPAYSLPGVAT